MTDATENECCFRLTGEVEGRLLSYDLVDGEHVVGAGNGCELAITGPGVSRRHALLSVADGVMSVRDLGSRNGTYVNGRKVEERAVDEGDWIGFGPAVLYVVRIHPDDARVAIPLHPGRRRGEGRDDTTAVEPMARRADDEPPSWVNLLSSLAAGLIGAEHPDQAEALELLRREVRADGACLTEWGGQGDPVVLCACGSIVEGERLAALAAELGELTAAGGAGANVTSGRLDGEPPVAWAAAAPAGATPYLLALTGDFPHRRAAGALLEAALRMLLHSAPEPVHIDPGRLTLSPPGLEFSPRHVVGRSAAITAVYAQLRQLLRGDIPVLITGETGVGKEHVAETLHASSPRARGPFVAVNCAAIPSDLLEAELFGIESGVATGVTARKGKFQLARGGFLFLDEIGDMSLELQAKLLRALQQLEIHPLGARSPEPIDVRIITATNTDLQALIAGNRFRRDLYYRVAGFTVHVPPLRARRDDIPAFVEHFMRLYAEEIGKPVRGITVKALNALAAAPWPGNVRELEHEVRRLVYLCPENQAIDSTMLSASVLYPSIDEHLAELDLASDLDLDAATATLERKLIAAALARTKGNRSKAAQLLGISRNGLALKMDRLGLS
ncbi:MAG: sigma 54-dependent Fis family transcriptional regulator [Thermoanaerobaculales bacterium]|jgi:transcriptional regulator with AAA-type ATPase domain|nr:sigma 54-dependent Fis family transcriptional regulator [Thermoanaerobaculales bacterium]